MSVVRLRATQVTDAVAYHGEGPVWLTGCLWPSGIYWVDMLAGDVLSLDGEGTVHRRNVGAVAAVVRPRRTGGLAYAVERGFAVDDGPGTPLLRLPELWSDPEVRMNEGGCDPAGNFYCGSMAFTARSGAGSFYRLAPDGDTELLQAGMTIPNGLEWSPDGSVAYHVDTTAGRVDVLDWDPEHGLRNRRAFVIVEGAGQPDGLTVDAEGGVWVAIWGAGEVHRYSPEGTLTAVVSIPAAQVSACTFGGPELDQLFVTTSRERLADPEPAAGALFRASPGVVGLPARPYAG